MAIAINKLRDFIDIRLVLRSAMTSYPTRRSLPGSCAFRRIVHDHQLIDRQGIYFMILLELSHIVAKVAA